MKPMTTTIGLILIVLASCGQFSNNSSQDNIINQKVEVTKESTNEFKLDKIKTQEVSYEIMNRCDCSRGYFLHSGTQFMTV
jgi:hypothetical protein